MRRLLLAVLLTVPAYSAVTAVRIVERTDVLDGKPFGAAGPYERIVARAHFAIDPKLPANRIISDIDLAPTNANGPVEFQSDIFVLKPRDPATGNGTVLFEVSNRGGKGTIGTFNYSARGMDPRTAEEFGDGFLLEQGYTLVWVGWQFDVPDKPGLMRLYAPAVKGITGLVRANFVLDKPETTVGLSDRGHWTYPVVDPATATLTVRTRVDESPNPIPRGQWSFPDSTHVAMPAGFEPGKIYDVVYKSQDPVLVGLGPAAIRDFISFLKYGGTETLLGDQRRHIKRSIGFGISQSGRFLRTFLYYGFNADEKGRKVFDGVWAHVAGAGRGSFNHRFAQPSRDGHPLLNVLYPTDILPFTDLEETDTETGQKGGLLAKAQQVPKIFYTNGSYEYWGRAASLIHTTPDGKGDAPLAPDTRIYFITGTQHGAGTIPPRRNGTQNLSNPNDHRPVMRALLVAMQAWLKDGREPPASRYPLISRGELVVPSELRFPKLPGVTVPTRPQRAYRGDFFTEPVKAGKPFQTMVPQVNADGNEIGGVRLPEVSVPLGAYTGWNLRDATLGAPDEMYSMVGSWFPFTKPRYAGRQAYLDQIKAAASALVSDGFVLERDVPRLLQRSAAEWDFVFPLR